MTIVFGYASGEPQYDMDVLWGRSAGVAALLMRTQLAVPENTFLDANQYDQLFTVHGVTMMFLFAVPMMEGMGIYLVPLMLGTRNVAFPRLNAFGYWMYLIGGLFLYWGLFTGTGPDVGWFAYTPLAGPQFSPGKRVDVWAQMITFTEISALCDRVGVPRRLSQLGVTADQIPALVRDSRGSSMSGNPRELSDAELTAILEETL